MFNFFRKKTKKEIQEAKNFKEAIKTIKFFIATLEWEKAQKAINEIKEKELNAYKEITNNIDLDYKSEEIEKQKEKINKTYSDKQQELEKLQNILNEKKETYEEKQKRKKFLIQFKLLKKEINQLTHTTKIHQAKKLLKQFLDENK
jgi:dephospho-CoA kinase